MAVLLMQALSENRCFLVDAEEEFEFDFYKFVMQWPGTVCKNQCPNRWTIHGLWPARNIDQMPNNCPGAYNATVIEELKNTTKLRDEWPNVDKSKGKTDEDVWKYEWTEHGSCSGLGLRNYFVKTLELAEKFNITRMLDDEGIKKGMNKVDDIINAVSNRTTTVPLIRTKCFRKKKSIYEIEICLNKTFQPINCEEYTFYPRVNQVENLKTSLPLVQANENGCKLSMDNPGYTCSLKSCS